MPVKPVFIHISKNAGSSIVSAARGHIVVAGHRTAASWVEEHGREGGIFAVVRNPFDRVVSEYSYRRRRFESGEHNPHLANLCKPFNDWVVSTFRDGEFRTRAFFERTGIPFGSYNMVGDSLIWFIPQVRWLCGADGTLLADDILRYETLEGDWASYARKHALPRTLPHVNASSRAGGYRHFYSAPARALVERHFQEDFDRFGYRFDG